MISNVDKQVWLTLDKSNEEFYSRNLPLWVLICNVFFITEVTGPMRPDWLLESSFTQMPPVSAIFTIRLQFCQMSLLAIFVGHSKSSATIE